MAGSQRQLTTTLNDPISGDRAEQLANDLQHQKSRLVIKEVVQDCIGSTEFETTVEKILRKSLERESTQDKLVSWFNRNYDTSTARRGWQNKTFWVPTIIATIAAMAAVAALFK